MPHSENWYARWHRHPQSNFIHWSALILVGIMAVGVVLASVSPNGFDALWAKEGNGGGGVNKGNGQARGLQNANGKDEKGRDISANGSAGRGENTGQPLPPLFEPTPPTEHAAVTTAIGQQTATLRQARLVYARASAAQKPAALTALTATAKTRQQELLSSAVLDPDAVLAQALSENERAGFPASVQAFLEKQVTVEGAPNLRVIDALPAHEELGREELVIQPEGKPVIALLGSQVQRPGQNVKKIRAKGVHLGKNGLGEVMVVNGRVETIESLSLMERLKSILVKTADAYALSGRKWANVNVTASFVPDGTIMDSGAASNLFAKFNAVAPTATWQREFARALQAWSTVTPLNFHFVTDNGAASGTSGQAQGDSTFGDIRIGAHPRSDSYVAYTYYPSSTTLGGDEFVNSDTTFHIGTYLDLYSTMLHETGHALGLAHSTYQVIMYPTILSVYTGLASDDIAGIQALYGARQDDTYDKTARNDLLANASFVNANTTITADLTSLADIDYYRITAPSSFNGNATFTVDATNISLLQPKVLVFDAAGTQLGTASATTYGASATLTLSGLLPGQTYYVASDGATADVFGMGAYNITTQFGGSVASSGTASSSAVVSSSFATSSSVAAASSSVSPDITPPAVSITSPANGATITGKSVKIVATATAASGIQSMKVLIDGKLTKTFTGVSIFTYNWSLSKVPSGSHTIQVSATSNANLTSSTSILVTK